MKISPLCRSTILVDAPRKTPIESTAPSSTTTPSATSERAPTKQLSSMMTGPACRGSSTPPIPTPPDKWTFLPICAHDPTIAQLSTIVPRSEEHTSELQSLMRNSYAVFCLKKKKQETT